MFHKLYCLIVRFFALPMIFVYDLFELWNVRDGGEKEHTGSDFDCICPKYFINRILAFEYGSGCFNKSLPKNGVSNVGIGFFSSVYSVEFGEFGMT